MADGSSEPQVNQLLADQRALKAQNDQLWKIVERQRAIIEQLQHAPDPAASADAGQSANQGAARLPNPDAFPGLYGLTNATDDSLVRSDPNSHPAPIHRSGSSSSIVSHQGPSLSSSQSELPEHPSASGRRLPAQDQPADVRYSTGEGVFNRYPSLSEKLKTLRKMQQRSASGSPSQQPVEDNPGTSLSPSEQIALTLAVDQDSMEPSPLGSDLPSRSASPLTMPMCKRPVVHAVYLPSNKPTAPIMSATSFVDDGSDSNSERPEKLAPARHRNSIPSIYNPISRPVSNMPQDRPDSAYLHDDSFNVSFLLNQPEQPVDDSFFVSARSSLIAQFNSKHAHRRRSRSFSEHRSQQGNYTTPAAIRTKGTTDHSDEDEDSETEVFQLRQVKRASRLSPTEGQWSPYESRFIPKAPTPNISTTMRTSPFFNPEVRSALAPSPSAPAVAPLNDTVGSAQESVRRQPPLSLTSNGSTEMPPSASSTSISDAQLLTPSSHFSFDVQGMDDSTPIRDTFAAPLQSPFFASTVAAENAKENQAAAPEPAPDSKGRPMTGTFGAGPLRPVNITASATSPPAQPAMVPSSVQQKSLGPTHRSISDSHPLHAAMSRTASGRLRPRPHDHGTFDRPMARLPSTKRAPASREGEYLLEREISRLNANDYPSYPLSVNPGAQFNEESFLSTNDYLQEFYHSDEDHANSELASAKDPAAFSTDQRPLRSRESSIRRDAGDQAVSVSRKSSQTSQSSASFLSPTGLASSNFSDGSLHRSDTHHTASPASALNSSHKPFPRPLGACTTHTPPTFEPDHTRFDQPTQHDSPSYYSRPPPRESVSNYYYDYRRPTRSDPSPPPPPRTPQIRAAPSEPASDNQLGPPAPELLPASRSKPLPRNQPLASVTAAQASPAYYGSSKPLPDVSDPPPPLPKGAYKPAPALPANGSRGTLRDGRLDPSPASGPELSHPPLPQLASSQPPARPMDSLPLETPPLLSLQGIILRVTGSVVKPNPKGKEVVYFNMAVRRYTGNLAVLSGIGSGPFSSSMASLSHAPNLPEGESTLLWTVQKLYGDFLQLDSEIRQIQKRSSKKATKLAKLPDKHLFNSLAPAKSDLCKSALENYLKHVLSVSLFEPEYLCKFLSTDILDCTQRNRPAGFKAGYLTKRGKNFGGWKRRFYIVTPDRPSLDYGDIMGGPKVGEIQLLGSKIARQKANEDAKAGDLEYRHAFMIMEKKKKGKDFIHHVFCAETDGEREEWIDALCYHIKTPRDTNWHASTPSLASNRTQNQPLPPPPPLPMASPLVGNYSSPSLAAPSGSNAARSLPGASYRDPYGYEYGPPSGSSSLASLPVPSGPAPWRGDQPKGSMDTYRTYRSCSIDADGDAGPSMPPGYTSSPLAQHPSVPAPPDHPGQGSGSHCPPPLPRDRSYPPASNTNGLPNTLQAPEPLPKDSPIKMANPALKVNTDVGHFQRAQASPRPPNSDKPSSALSSGVLSTPTSPYHSARSRQDMTSPIEPQPAAPYTDGVSHPGPPSAMNPTAGAVAQNGPVETILTPISAPGATGSASSKLPLRALDPMSNSSPDLMSPNSAASGPGTQSPSGRPRPSVDSTAGQSDHMDNRTIHQIMSEDFVPDLPDNTPTVTDDNLGRPKHPGVGNDSNENLSDGSKRKKQGRMTFTWSMTKRMFSPHGPTTPGVGPGSSVVSSPSSGTFNGGLSLFGDSSKPKTSGPVFGVPLEQAVATSRVKDNYDLPAIVYRTIEYLDAKDAASEEGIYRLSGSTQTIRTLRQKFDVDGDYNILKASTYYDVHAIAGLLKLYLRELPTSVLTSELHPEFMKIIDLVDRRERVRELGRLVSVLPLANYTMLRALTAHLIRIVRKADHNKMTLRNVGIVFSPSLGIPAGIFNLLILEFRYIFWVNDDGLPAPRPMSEVVDLSGLAAAADSSSPSQVDDSVATGDYELASPSGTVTGSKLKHEIRPVSRNTTSAHDGLHQTFGSFAHEDESLYCVLPPHYEGHVPQGAVSTAPLKSPTSPSGAAQHPHRRTLLLMRDHHGRSNRNSLLYAGTAPESIIQKEQEFMETLSALKRHAGPDVYSDDGSMEYPHPTDPGRGAGDMSNSHYASAGSSATPPLPNDHPAGPVEVEEVDADYLYSTARTYYPYHNDRYPYAVRSTSPRAPPSH
ncbi:Rho GTPase activating protein [Dimargaris xerosporica]|nr:Rho GTPase activating protein [Dimargaris xerosporica]